MPRCFEARLVRSLRQPTRASNETSGMWALEADNQVHVLCVWQELLRGLNLGDHKAAVPSLAVALSLEGKASHRELTSRLLSDLVGKVLSPEDIAAAFDGMLRDLPDLILDTPEAPQVRQGRGVGVGRGGSWPSNPDDVRLSVQMLGQFIARAVADHALPLDFLGRYKGRVGCEHAR